MLLQQQAIAIEFILLTRTVFACAVVLRGQLHEVAGQLIGATHHLRITKSVAVLIRKAVSVAIFSDNGIQTCTIVHICFGVEIARFSIETSTKRLNDCQDLHKLSNVPTSI